VGGAGQHLPGPQVHDDFGGLGQGAGRIHHVVDDDGHLVPDLADDVHYFGLVGRFPPLVDYGDGHIQLFGEGAGSLHAPGVGGNQDHVPVTLEPFPQILQEDRGRVEVVNGDVEKALNLAGVEVHAQEAVGPGGGQEIGHQLGGDGHPGGGFAVLPGIAVVGQDRVDAAGRSPLQGVHDDQEFHEVVVDGAGGGLDDVDVAPPHVFAQLHPDFAVGKAAQEGRAQGLPQVFGYFPGQGGVGAAADQYDVIIHGATN